MPSKKGIAYHRKESYETFTQKDKELIELLNKKKSRRKRL